MAFSFDLRPQAVPQSALQRDWSFMDQITNRYQQRKEDRQATEAATAATSGIDPETAGRIAPLLANSQTRQAGLQMLREAVKPKEYGFTTAPDGTLLRTDAQAGTAEAIGNYARPREPKAPSAPTLVDIYDIETGQPYKAMYNPATGGWERVGGVKAPSGTQLSVGPDGQVSFVQGSGMKPLTEAQSKDAVYATRAAGALPIIDEIGDALTSLGQTVGGSAPVVGNYLKSPEYQKAEQAGLEFLQAILRKDTGAAVPAEEIVEYGSVYLPRPGDSPEVLAQKKASRARAVNALKLGLPPQVILQLEREGISLPDMPRNEPSPGTGQPKTRRYNPATGRLE